MLLVCLHTTTRAQEEAWTVYMFFFCTLHFTCTYLRVWRQRNIRSSNER